MDLQVTAESIFQFHIAITTTDGARFETMLTQDGGEWRLGDAPAGKSPYIGGNRIEWPEALKRALTLLSTSST